ncbi:MAG: radical SAM protein [Lachnospiraceae bacterium]|nr:radical SAM protein [Lachnospiraceae bacterium]
MDVYIDRLAHGESYDGIPVKRFEDIDNIQEYYVINCASSAFWDISEFLFDHEVETVYHALPLLEMLPEDQEDVLEMFDTRSKYKHCINREEDSSIYRLSVVITERCSLKCKNCTEYVPYIKNKEHEEIESCIQAVKKLLEAIGKLDSIMIQGGEIFTHPHWDILVKWCCEEKRIARVIILTNATIIPKEWEALQNRKVLLALDDYHEVSSRLLELKDMARQKGIDHTVLRHDHWFDVADCGVITDDPAALKQKFAVCQLKGCWVISGHFLYRCTTSYYKMKYMLSKKIEEDEDFIDLFTLSPEKIREQIKRLSKADYLSACRYCRGTSTENLIGVAEQL